MRAGISSFARTDLAPGVEAGLERLRADVASGDRQVRQLATLLARCIR